jgi:hypothetical protein
MIALLKLVYKQNAFFMQPVWLIKTQSSFSEEMVIFTGAKGRNCFT